VAEAAGSAVGARRVTTRMLVPGAPDQVASWTSDGPEPATGPELDVAVVDRGEQLGTVSVTMPAGRTLRPGDQLLLQHLVDQSAIAFRNARLSAELAHQVGLLDRRTRELDESRRRLITAGDAERSRLERSIARGVVPHLRRLPAQLDELARSAPDGLHSARVRALVDSATTALEELREITRGVFPAQLARSGLEPALSSLLGRSGTGRLVVDPSASGRRLDPRVEAAAYFCVAEAARDLQAPVEVTLSVPDGRLLIGITGSGPGHLPVASLRDRAEAVDGSVTVDRAAGTVRLEVCLPASAALHGALR
jgi:signal transduction histidine kinase